MMKSAPRPFTRYHRFTVALILLVILLVGFASIASGDPGVSIGEEVASPAEVTFDTELAESVLTADGTIAVFIEMQQTPTALVYQQSLAQSRLPKALAEGIASVAARSQLHSIERAQSRLASDLALAAPDAEELYRVQTVLNGVATQIAPAALDAVRALPGVKAVHLLVPETIENSTSVPFLGTPQVWEGLAGSGLPVQGQNISIGIIDTGIDYQHSHFGGTGVITDYQANDRTVITDSIPFPTAKVVGGWDFAGDAYTGVTPTPDPDPMDCNGHGTHVAGTAAGYGVNADGSTFTGPYDTSAAYGSLRIGPGTAPQADLYALRVFGCTGSTNLTVAAIEWAVDPDDNGDPSDHLDIINMSLGSAFGAPSNASVLAANNAVAAGVVVVTSAGNNGDTYFITGSPGAASRALSTASSIDSGIPAARLTVNSPASIDGNYPAGYLLEAGPSITAYNHTANVVQAVDGVGTTSDACSALTNAAAMAGNIALVDMSASCTITAQVPNAQNAGAIAVILVYNVVGATVPPSYSGAAAAITVPVIVVTRADGDRIRSELASTVNVTIAASNGGDTLSSFSSRGPSIGGFLKPDIAAPGQNITSAQTGVVSGGYNADNKPLTISGTSMASPHMAGIMALLRQLHPTWSVEELKALAMNGALHDVTIGAEGGGPRYGPGRIGAGRADPVVSADLQTVAFNADDLGRVSVTFEGEIASVMTDTRRIRVVNHGTTAATFDLGIDTVVDAPGVGFSLPGGSSVTVPAGESVILTVQMDADPSLMDHTRDATVASVQTAPGTLASLGNLARHWLTEEAGYVTFSQGGTVAMRVPVYAAPRPTSQMSASDTIVTGGSGTGSTNIPLSGSGVCTGTLGAGPTCAGSFPTVEVSLVTPFELQVVSPIDPTLDPATDLQYTGVAYSASSNQVFFGVSTWGEWSTPTEVAFNIYVDTNEDGTYDRILFNSNPGTMAGALFGNTGVSAQDSFYTAYLNLATSGVGVTGFVNRVSSATADSALFNSNVMFLAATPTQLGLAAGDTTFRYRVQTCPGYAPLCGFLNGFHADAADGPYFWNYNAQGLNFGGGNLYFDLNGATLPVTWNTANMATNGTLGALLLHHHNTDGTRAEVSVLEGTPTADLSITTGISPTLNAFSQALLLTTVVTNNGPNDATGVQAAIPLPLGMDFVADDSGGAYDPLTGIWTIGSLASGASATLNMDVRLTTTAAVQLKPQVSAASPVDTDPTDNQMNFVINAAQQTDLSVSLVPSATEVAFGATTVFSMTVTNLGDDTAYNLEVTADLKDFTQNSFTASEGTYTPATGLWNLASLDVGETALLRVETTAPNTAGNRTTTAAGQNEILDTNSANDTADAIVEVVNPLAVTLGGFAAEGTANGVVLQWETLSEIRNVGFNVLRSTNANTPGDALNDTLIASQGPNSSQGFSYKWVDSAVEAETTYYYWLEAVDVDGKPTRFGPVSASVQVPTAITSNELAAQSGNRVLPLAMGMLLLAAVAGMVVVVRRKR